MFLLTLAAGYTLLLAVLLWGWRRDVRRARERPPATPEATPFVSVLVAARNEARTLGRCLEALLRQDYPSDRYEVIVIDDRSTDATCEVARMHAARDARIQVVLKRSEGPYRCPKKSALAAAMTKARGEIIATTDADCWAETGWLRAMVSRCTPEVGMVVGASPVAGARTALEHLAALESLLVPILARSAIGLGWPLACTGRSLAYRREAFDQVGGFSRTGGVVGGDDVLLLHELRKRTQWRVAFCPLEGALVWTLPDRGTTAARSHRLVRRAAKALWQAPTQILCGLWVVVFYLALVWAAFDALGGGDPMPLVLALAAKLGVDALVMTRGTRAFKVRALERWIPLGSLLHVIAFPTAHLLGVLGTYRWPANAPLAAPSGSEA